MINHHNTFARSKIKIGADAEADGGDVRVIGVGEPFNKIQPEDGKDVIDADAAFYIGLTSEGISGAQSFGEGKLHLFRIECGIVLITQSAIQDLSCHHFS